MGGKVVRKKVGKPAYYKKYGARWGALMDKYGRNTVLKTAGEFGRHKANVRLSGSARGAASMNKAAKAQRKRGAKPLGYGSKRVDRVMAGAQHDYDYKKTVKKLRSRYGSKKK